MKIIHVLILAMIQVTVIPVVAALSARHQTPAAAALSARHQTPAAVHLVSSENMTTIYERPGIATYSPRAAAPADVSEVLEM